MCFIYSKTWRNAAQRHHKVVNTSGKLGIVFEPRVVRYMAEYYNRLEVFSSDIVGLLYLQQNKVVINNVCT